MSAKSSVVLNFRSSGQVLPGMPVSRPIKWTSMVGMDQDSVLRVVRGAESAGRAMPTDKTDGRCMLTVIGPLACRQDDRSVESRLDAIETEY